MLKTIYIYSLFSDTTNKLLFNRAIVSYQYLLRKQTPHLITEYSINCNRLYTMIPVCTFSKSENAYFQNCLEDRKVAEMHFYYSSHSFMTTNICIQRNLLRGFDLMKWHYFVASGETASHHNSTTCLKELHYSGGTSLLGHMGVCPSWISVVTQF